MQVQRIQANQNVSSKGRVLSTITLNKAISKATTKELAQFYDVIHTIADKKDEKVFILSPYFKNKFYRNKLFLKVQDASASPIDTSVICISEKKRNAPEDNLYNGLLKKLTKSLKEYYKNDDIVFSSTRNSSIKNIMLRHINNELGFTSGSIAG